jgi:hypothetical protein
MKLHKNFCLLVQMKPMFSKVLITMSLNKLNKIMFYMSLGHTLYGPLNQLDDPRFYRYMLIVNSVESLLSSLYTFFHRLKKDLDFIKIVKLMNPTRLEILRD